MKKLNVLGLQVKVIKKKDYAKKTGFEGLFDPYKNEITIDADLKKQEYIGTLIHEIGHAIFHRGGVFQTKIPMEVHEIIVEQFSTVIVENFNLTRKRK